MLVIAKDEERAKELAIEKLEKECGYKEIQVLLLVEGTEKEFVSDLNE